MRAYKTEINPIEKQKTKTRQTIGVCRFIYNFYLAHNKEIYEKEKRFVSGMDFSKWLNNDFIPNNPEYSWIKDVSSKAVKQSIMNGEKAFKRFFKGQSKFPKFKKKNKSDVKVYFPKNNETDWTIERHRIKIPTLGYVQLKEKNYIPTNKKVNSGTVSMKANRYYVSVLIDDIEAIPLKSQNKNIKIGIDLGIKDFATVNVFNKPFKNINKTSKVKKLEKKLKKEQKRLSRKYESLKEQKKICKNKIFTNKNIDKQKIKVQKIHQRLTNIRHNHISQVVSEVVKTKPQHITIEDLNVKGMMKNRHLSKAIGQQNFNRFRALLEDKCKNNGIELRIVSRWFPSSKTCSCCGYIKKDLKLSDRIFTCDICRLTINRDKNASINLADAKEYTVA